MWSPTRRRRTGSVRRSAWSCACAARAVGVLGALALVAGGCSGGDAAPGSSTEAPARPARTPAELTDTTCSDPGVPPERARCQTLTVPEDRSDPEGRQVELPVLRLQPGTAGTAGTAGAADAPAAVPPVVVLHGGPGGSGVGDWSTWTSRFDGPAEIVLWDQRGGGESVPRLDCPEHRDALMAALGGVDDPAAEQERVASALRACHERLSATGVDLDSYDTPTSTEDLEDLRRAIGAERITLVGSSYGTRLALDYLRTYPQRVHSLVLDSVDPPRATGPSTASLAAEAVDRLAESCAADRGCAGAHPDLRAELDAVLESFDRAPRSLTVTPTDGGPSRAVTLTGEDLFAGLYVAMYDSDVVPLLPSLITAAGAVDVADGSVLDTFASRALPALSSTATGAYLSIDCADSGGHSGGHSGDEPADGRASTLALAGSLPYCDAWPVEPVPGSFRSPIEVEDPPPTLVVAGELDPITPAADGRALAERLGAHFVELPRAGHAPMLVHPCAQAVLESFLSDPAAPNLSCTEDLTPPPFA